MVFGYWAIFTGVICVVGFTYMTVASFSDRIPDETKKNEDSAS